MTTTILINRRDFNGSPVCLNGQSIPLPTGVNFEASDELLVLLGNAKVRYSRVTAQGDATGRIIIPADGPYGGRLPLTINGKTYFLPIGEAFTPATGVTVALANARVPFTSERSATSALPTVGDAVFASAQFRTYGQSALFAPASGRLTEIMDLYVPAQPAGARVAFSNFSLESTTLAAGSPREVLPGNINTIDFAVFFTGANGTGTRQPLSFGGQVGAVMADGGFAVSDALPQAFAGGWLRVSITTPTGGSRMQGQNPSTVLAGESRRQYTGPQPALADGGAISGGSTITANTGYYPTAILAPKAAGSKSILLIGDSITQQDDQAIFMDARGMLGGIVRGLDSETGGRIGVGNFGHHGAQMIDFMDVTAGSRKFSQRFAILSYIKDTINGGRWPFDAIWSQGLRNDFSGMTVIDPTDALAQFNARADGWWTWLAATFPAVPIIQSTVSARVTADTTTGYTTLEGQNPRTLNMGPALISFNDRIMTKPAPLSLAVDLRAQMEEVRVGIGPVVKRTDFTLAGGGTLVNAIAIGGSYAGVQISASVAPQIGTYLVLEPGTANFEQRAVITSVVPNGGNLYTISVGSTAGKAHAAGAAMATANTSDGTHPSPVIQQAWATPVIGAKSAISAL